VRHTTPFTAKYEVKCTKTQGKMHQNAMRNAPKRKAKCTKTQGKMHQNARQNAPKRKAKCCKTQGECNNMQCKKGLNTLSTD